MMFIQFRSKETSTVQYSTVQYSTVQYSTAQYSTAQHSTEQYSNSDSLWIEHGVNSLIRRCRTSLEDRQNG